jgi:hypothetical protein
LNGLAGLANQAERDLPLDPYLDQAQAGQHVDALLDMPFIWTKSAHDILQKVIRANARLSSEQNETLH